MTLVSRYGKIKKRALYITSALDTFIADGETVRAVTKARKAADAIIDGMDAEYDAGEIIDMDEWCNHRFFRELK